MRHQPERVDRVAGEAAAEVVVDAALADVGQRVQDGMTGRGIAGRERVPPDQVEDRRLRELGRAAEAAVDGIERLDQPPCGLLAHGRRERRTGGRPRETGERLLQRRRVAHDLVAVAGPDPADGVQHLRQAGPAIAGLRREIGAAPERLAGRSQEHGQRPAAVLAEQCQRVLIDLVEVRPLLAIDLDVDELVVHLGRDLRVLEALVGHHVAPVAGGVADRQQDRLVLRARRRERRLVPGLPIDRIVPVLEQIGAGRLAEAVVQGRHPEILW